jgi:hypothetical protein
VKKPVFVKKSIFQFFDVFCSPLIAGGPLGHM